MSIQEVETEQQQSSFNDDEIMLKFPDSPFIGNTDLQQYLRNDFVNEEALKAYGDQKCESHFKDILSHLCRPPKITCVRINSPKVSSHKAKQMITEHLNESVGYGKFEIWEHPLVSDAILIRSLTSADFLEPCEKVVVVDLACGVAVLRGSHIYAPGVMSMHPKIESGDQVSVIIDVQGKCLRGAIKPFEGEKLFVGNGVCRISRQQLFTTPNLKGIAVVMMQMVCMSPSLGDFLPELIFLQNLPSIVCGHVLDPQPGDHVLDMCASPGGKTTHLATLMKNCGRVVAVDKTKPKVEKIRENARRWGATCVEAYVFDSTKICKPSAGTREISPDSGLGQPPYAPDTFDKILLDTPCSALGQRPQLCNKMTVNQLKSYRSLQRKLFAQGLELLKPGGILVYSTCSLTLEENEQLVSWALSTFLCLQLATQQPHIGQCGRIGAGLSNDHLAKLQRFGLCRYSIADILHTENCENPDEHLNGVSCTELCDTIGFFIAKFVKEGK